MNNPEAPKGAQQNCVDCGDGPCYMNCGPAIPKTDDPLGIKAAMKIMRGHLKLSAPKPADVPDLKVVAEEVCDEMISNLRHNVGKVERGLEGEPAEWVERLMPACGVDSVMRVTPYMVDIEDGLYIRYSDYERLADQLKAALAAADRMLEKACWANAQRLVAEKNFEDIKAQAALRAEGKAGDAPQ